MDDTDHDDVARPGLGSAFEALFRLRPGDTSSSPMSGTQPARVAVIAMRHDGTPPRPTRSRNAPRRNAREQENELLFTHIEAIHADPNMRSYGSPRVHAELTLGLGLTVNEKRVAAADARRRHPGPVPLAPYLDHGPRPARRTGYRRPVASTTAQWATAWLLGSWRIPHCTCTTGRGLVSCNPGYFT